MVRNEINSPCSPLKKNPFSQDTYSSPSTPLRLDSAESPLLPKQNDRFVNQDSLYLDIGKPELNGRTDTLTSGSTSNSILLAGKSDSIGNISSTYAPPSTFANKNVNRSGSKLYKASNPIGTNQSLMKAAIFRNMQKNNSEGVKEDDVDKNKHENLQVVRAHSENASPATSEGQEENSFDNNQSPEKENQIYLPENDNAGVCSENTDVQINVEQRNLSTHDKHPSKPSSLSMRKFHPFAPANLIIPKNESYNGM